MIYFTSDLHLGHCTVLKHRPEFGSIDEMNETFISNINETVTARDTLYILGDLTFRIGEDEANDLIRRINGRKILLRGNHDVEYDPGLFERISDYEVLKYNKKVYVLMHYPLVCWDKMRFGAVQLHGHIHSGAGYNDRHHEMGRLQFDVGVDANGYRPVPISVIAAWADSAPWQEYKGREHHQLEEE